MHRAVVNKIIPFSSVDGPGNRTAVFLQGCNFNCLYCHNPETINHCKNCGECVEVCPVGALASPDGTVTWNPLLCVGCDACIGKCQHNSSPKTERLTAAEAYDSIRVNLPFVNGITISGGECTLQHAFVEDLAELVRKSGKTVYIDSNGYIPFEAMPRLTELMDYAMLDVKSVDEAEHRMLTRKSVSTVLENVEYLAKLGKLFEIRTVVIPQFLDNERTVSVASKLIAPYKNIRYKLIKYRQNGVRDNLLSAQSPSDELMERLRDIAQENGVADIVII